MTITVNSQQIKTWAQALGFDLVGICSPKIIPRSNKLLQFIKKGYAGEMTYLERNVSMRMDPSELMPQVQAIICVGMNYYTGDGPTQGNDGEQLGKVARYAWGKDYHVVIKKRLKTLGDLIIENAKTKTKVRRVVDTAPLLEREYAAQAGLGWIGKNGLLINQWKGSYFLLGELLCDLEGLDFDEPAANMCGSCSACLSECPTDAFEGPGVLDPRKCISYLTIESRKDIPKSLAPKLGDRLYGCDICQEVCPYNKRATINEENDMQPRDSWKKQPLEASSAITDAQYKARFKGSAMVRANPDHFRHVATIIKENINNGFAC
jgi:epoxyqueuosine reductase